MTPKKPDDRLGLHLQLWYQPERVLQDRPIVTALHKVRDGLSAVQLISLLTSKGLVYQGCHLNIPKGYQMELGEEMVKNPPNIRKGDVVLLTTRPAIDDDRSRPRPRRSIQRSYLDVEIAIFDNLKACFFATCDRSQVVLQKFLSPINRTYERIDEYRAVTFYEQKGACVKRLNAFKAPRGLGKDGSRDIRLTLGYLAVLPKVECQEEGVKPFRCISCFGMGGTETLVLSWLLHNHFSDLIDQALSCQSAQLWIVPFLVPDRVPTTLHFDLKELIPLKENQYPTCWRLKTT